MQTLKPPRRDVTNTQWYAFESKFNKLVSDQAAFRTSVTAKLDKIIQQTAPAPEEPPATP